MARHRARQQALQLLFEWDIRRIPLDEISKGYYESLLVSEESPVKPIRDAFAEALVRGVITEIGIIDESITKHAEHWKIQRMPTVDRNLLRMAAYEMLRTDTPAA